MAYVQFKYFGNFKNNRVQIFAEGVHFSTYVWEVKMYYIKNKILNASQKILSLEKKIILFKKNVSERI